MKPLFPRNGLGILSLAVLLLALAFIYPKAGSVINNRGPLPRSNTQPAVMLWAWERPTDLRFINTQKVGVAFLARSITLKNDQVLVRPRLQSLQLPDGTRLIAVARVETVRDDQPRLSTLQRETVKRAILDMLSMPNLSGIQIDFDATQSQRDFYRELITDIRAALPANVSLSITALASWCTYDDWISDLPIDQAVPMLFRMAGDGKQIMTRLNEGDDFNAVPCRQSYGISLDEQRPKLFPSRTLFVFNPGAWTEKSVRDLLESTP